MHVDLSLYEYITTITILPAATFALGLGIAQVFRRTDQRVGFALLLVFLGLCSVFMYTQSGAA